jgi:hypothetical protein
MTQRLPSLERLGEAEEHASATGGRAPVAKVRSASAEKLLVHAMSPIANDDCPPSTTRANPNRGPKSSSRARASHDGAHALRRGDRRYPQQFPEAGSIFALGAVSRSRGRIVRAPS